MVTGGGRGIGAGIAEAFAASGAHVSIADRDGDAAERVAQELRRSGAEALACVTDVRDPAACQEMVAQVLARWGRVDVLVNNAGGTRRAAFLELGPEGWDKHMALNLTGLFAPTDAVARAMIRAERGGVILNVASIEGLRAAPGYSVYAACKAGMLNFTKTLALESAEHRIRVNAIAPDIVDTPALAEFMAGAPEQRQQQEALVPLGRLGDVRDCAQACVFLASEGASYLTGITLSVDGGTSAAGGWRRNEQGNWVLGG